MNDVLHKHAPPARYGIVAFMLVLLVSFSTRAAEPFTNHLAIHLLADRAAWISNRTIKPYGNSVTSAPLNAAPVFAARKLPPIRTR